jgi:hypothetical protein
VSKSTLDDDILTLNVAELGEALSKGIEDRARRVIRNYANARMPGRILGRREVRRQHQRETAHD